MIPLYPQFKELTKDDRKIFLQYLENYSPKICELNPANFFLWKNFDLPKATIINNNLCVLLSPIIEPPFFLEPIGRNRLEETVEICLRHAGRISRASEDLITLLPKKSYRIHCLRSQCDYVYLTKELAALKGKKYDGKRNHIKRFINHYSGYYYVPLEKQHKKQALALFEKWSAIKKETRHLTKLAYTAQKTCLETAFSYFEELSLIGGAIVFENEIKGFIIASQLNPETADVHFMYGDPEMRGVTQTLLWEACNKTISLFKLVNLEQDLGITGIRTSKLSYHPYKIERKFEIRLKV